MLPDWSLCLACTSSMNLSFEKLPLSSKKDGSCEMSGETMSPAVRANISASPTLMPASFAFLTKRYLSINDCQAAFLTDSISCSECAEDPVIISLSVVKYSMSFSKS